MGQRYTLFFTAREGREDDLRWALYDRKISPDLRDPDSKQTALHLAAAKGRVGCVQLLIDAGKAQMTYQMKMKTQWYAALNSESHKTGELYCYTLRLCDQTKSISEVYASGKLYKLFCSSLQRIFKSISHNAWC